MSKHIKVHHNNLRKRRERWLAKARLLGRTVTTITAARKVWKQSSVEQRQRLLKHLDGLCDKNECSWCFELASNARSATKC